MLGKKQVTLRWEDYPVQRKVGGGYVGTERGFPPRRISGIGNRGRGGSIKQVSNH